MSVCECVCVCVCKCVCVCVCKCKGTSMTSYAQASTIQSTCIYMYHCMYLYCTIPVQYMLYIHVQYLSLVVLEVVASLEPPESENSFLHGTSACRHLLHLTLQGQN